MKRDDRRYMAHPAHDAEWMWGPEEERETRLDEAALTLAFGVAVVTIVIVTVLLVGGAVGTALGFAMGVPV